MSRSLRYGFAAIVAAVAFSAGWLSTPKVVFACSCAPSEVMDYIGDPEVVIVSGAIVGVDEVRGSGTFLLDRVFQGSVPALQMPVFGTGGGDCTISLEEGMQFIGVARISEGEFVPGLCAPHGDLRDEQGRTILADLRQVFPDPPEQAAEAAPLAPIATVAVGFGVLLILLVAFVSMRERRAA